MATSATTSNGRTSSDVTDREVATLRHRADSLRQQAGALDEVLALTYRRRASELEMEAWVHEVQAGVGANEVLSTS